MYLQMIDVMKMCACAMMGAVTFDLQRFANPNVNTTGSADLSGENKVYYHDTLVDSAEPYLVHSQFGMDIPIPAHGGKTVELRIFDVIDKNTTALQEGVTPDGNSMKMRTINAEVKQYGDYVTVSDVASVTMIDPLILQATKAMGSQAGRSLDTVYRDVITAGTQVMYAPKISGGVETEIASRANLTAECVLTPDMCYRAQAQLKAMLAEPIGRSYVGIVHPYAAYDLMRTDDFIEMHKYAAVEELYNGEIGKVGNIRFVESTEAKVVKGGTGGNLGVYLTMILGKDAYAVTSIKGLGLEHIFKPLGSGDDPLNQRATIGWKATASCLRVKEQNMVRIESCGHFSDVVEAN